MTDFYYSVTANAVYSADEREYFENAGMWPDDAVLMPQDVFNEFFIKLPPNGKIRSGGPDGLPVWIETPPLSIEQLTKLAEQKRATLRNAADAEIAWLQYAVDQGKATSEESSDLIKWQDYRLDLMRVDTSNPIWPTPPGEQVVSVAVQVK